MRTVLLIDDSAVARHALAQRLAADRFDIADAASVAAARKIDVTTLACVIVDLELPDGDGTDLARALAAKRRSLPIAFFTQGGSPTLLEAARGQGSVFLKPDMEPVVAWVKRVLRPSQPPSQPPPTK